MTIRTLRVITAVLALAGALGGCATTRAPDPRDPLEPVNRAIFEFNDNVDKFALKPVAQGYNFVLPSVMRTGVRNFFSNLRDPWIGVNNLLQGKVEWAISDAFRFIANSTFGLGGVFDIASDMRLQKHNEDFGQTLGRWGLDTGPYLVLPILGPSDVRDGVGLIADAYAYVPWYLPRWLDFSHEVAWRNSLLILDVINVRANGLGTTDLFDVAALDRYAFVRNAYLQRRRNLVYDGNPPPLDADKPVSLETEPSREPVALVLVRQAPYAGPQLQVVDPKVPSNYDAVLAAGGQRVAARAALAGD